MDEKYLDFKKEIEKLNLRDKGVSLKRIKFFKA